MKKRAYVPLPLDSHPELDVNPELTSVVTNFYQKQSGGTLMVGGTWSYLHHDRGHTCICRGRGIWMMFTNCSRTLCWTTMPELCVIRPAPISMRVPSSTLIGRQCMGISRMWFPLMCLLLSARRLTFVCMWTLMGFVIILNMDPIVAAAYCGINCLQSRFFCNAKLHRYYPWDLLQVVNDACAPERPCYVYGDNMSVIHDIQLPESVLEKKSNSICYHVAHEPAAMSECIMAHVSSENNPADMCTKVVPTGQTRYRLSRLLIYDHAGLWLCEYPPR
jgi:hypothetical protein